MTQTMIKFRKFELNYFMSVTPCPHKKKTMIGSASCEKCYYCRGINERLKMVSCSYGVVPFPMTEKEVIESAVDLVSRAMKGIK